jgi:uncharacterized integral membrane protein (TIGR00697 family)
MSNELLIIVTALVNIFGVFLASRLGTRYLFAIIAIDLILISTFGSKLIELFGLVTNAGNVFYACIFLATHFILEQKGTSYTRQTIWFGIGCTALFIVLSQLAVGLSSFDPQDPIASSMRTLFSFSLRIALASLLAYAFSQYVNIALYAWLKAKTQGAYVWLRSNVANICAQLVDSTLFFTIAFLDLPAPALLQAIFAGWLIKVLVVGIGTPLLYLDLRSRSLK